jgi:hypothetical protein
MVQSVGHRASEKGSKQFIRLSFGMERDEKKALICFLNSWTDVCLLACLLVCLFACFKFVKPSIIYHYIWVSLYLGIGFYRF